LSSTKTPDEASPLLPIAVIGAALSRANRFLIRPWLVLPDALVSALVMFLTSALVMSLEVINFHLLLYVTDYIKATSVISVALLGIAMGGFLAFALGGLPRLPVLVAGAALLAFSIVLGYVNILNIADWGQPLFLILPFIFASLVVSTLFAAGDTNLLYFFDLAGAGLGIILPILLLPAFKSEMSLFALLWIPVVLALLLAFRARHLLVKLALVIAILAAALSLNGFLARNLGFPERWERSVFEVKILAEMPPADKTNYDINYVRIFLDRVYKKASPVAGSQAGNYVFSGDAYDYARLSAFMQVLGFEPRFGIPFLTAPGGRTMPADLRSIPAQLYEQEILPAVRRRYDYRFAENYDLRFLKSAYTLEGDSYVLTRERYARERAKLLLGDLGHFPFIDLGIDLPRHGSFSTRFKFFNENPRIILSEDSTIGRIEYTSNTFSIGMAQNGVYLDNIDPYNGNSKDPRVPHLGAGKVFIVGLSADGIAKSVKRMPGTTVTGVELNPIIWRTMTDGGTYQVAAADPYKDVAASFGEARSWLETSREKWNMITLMNIHAGHGAVSSLAPENFHTVEGTTLLLNSLAENGLIDYEEILIGPRSELAFLKFINTLKTALRGIGVAEPEKNIHVFRWAFFGGSAFRTVSVKRTAFTEAEIAQMDAFIQKVKDTGNYTGVSLVYSPYKTLGTEIETFMRGKDKYSMEYFPTTVPLLEFRDRILSKLSDVRDQDFVLGLYTYNGSSGYNAKPESFSEAQAYRLRKLLEGAGYPLQIDLRPVTDDMPFPYNVYAEKREVKEILSPILYLSLFLFVPLAILLLRSIGQGFSVLAPGVLSVALSGFGYMLVEIVFIQRFQLFLGDPTLTLIVVLGGMLVSSGLGSLASRWFPRWLVFVAAALIPVLLVAYMLQLGNLFHAFSALGQNAKAIMTLAMIFPVSFLMGIPFPMVMGAIKSKVSADYSALMFGVNGAFSTLGSLLSILINVTDGFHRSFEVGTLAYALGLLFFAIVLLSRRKEAA